MRPPVFDQSLSGLLSTFCFYRLKLLGKDVVDPTLHLGVGLASSDFLLDRALHPLLEVQPGQPIQILLLAKNPVRMRNARGDESCPLPGLVSLSLLFLLRPLLRLNDRLVEPVSDAFGDRHEL